MVKQVIFEVILFLDEVEVVQDIIKMVIYEVLEVDDIDFQQVLEVQVQKIKITELVDQVVEVVVLVDDDEHEKHDLHLIEEVEYQNGIIYDIQHEVDEDEQHGEIDEQVVYDEGEIDVLIVHEQQLLTLVELIEHDEVDDEVDEEIELIDEIEL